MKKKYVQMAAILLMVALPMTASATDAPMWGGGDGIGEGAAMVFGLGIAALAAATIAGLLYHNKKLKEEAVDMNDPENRRKAYRKELKENAWVPNIGIAPLEDGAYGALQWSF